MKSRYRRHHRIKMILAFGWTLLILCIPPDSTARAQSAAGAVEKLSGEITLQLQGAAPGDLVPVIVRTRTLPDAADFSMVASRGGAVKGSFSRAIRGYSARIPASQMSAVADDPDVERISLDSPVKAHLDVAPRAIKADLAVMDSGGLDGSGVGVAVIDTGVIDHLDFGSSKRSSILEIEIVGREPGAADYFGHGTHVAGILGGNGASSSDRSSFRTFRGVAPGARLISIRALGPDGTGFTSDIISGIEWAIANQKSYNIRVLNLSLGHPIYESHKTDPLCLAVRAATDAGIVVVVAAGNDGAVGSGFGTITSPANEPSAITVGAMDDFDTVTTLDDVLEWYSSRGPTLVDHVAKPDLVAPGTWIVSVRSAGSYLDTNFHDFTLRLSEYKSIGRKGDGDGEYFTMSGTSMAAPMVAGAAALMFQREPELNPATVKARLMRSAVKDERLIFETGAGYLDVQAALKETATAQSALSPRVLLADDGTIYVEDTAVLWGETWTYGAIWGGRKGAAQGVDPLAVDEGVLETYGAIWKFRGGSKSIVDNDGVTGSGWIWGAEGSSLLSTTGTVDMLGAIWRRR